MARSDKEAMEAARTAVAFIKARVIDEDHDAAKALRQGVDDTALIDALAVFAFGLFEMARDKLGLPGPIEEQFATLSRVIYGTADWMERHPEAVAKMTEQEMLDASWDEIRGYFNIPGSDEPSA